MTDPPGAFIGLPEAAALLGVHYMTAYRYVRTGRLPATAVGGVWRIEVSAVRALAEADPARGRVTRGSGRGSGARTAAMIERRMVDGDAEGAFAICESALSSWATAPQLYADVLVPALRRIGDRWQGGELSVADEHRATAVASRVMGRLGSRFAHPGRRRGSVVVGAPAGDRHALPSALVGDLLRHAGFWVVDLGADTPADAFVDAAQRSDRLVAVAIGATTAGNESAIAAAVTAVHEALPGIPVVIGGAGVPTAALGRQLGADIWSGDDGQTAVALITSLTVGSGSR